MAARVLVVSDTHCHRWEEVEPGIRAAVAQADLVVHCGDYTGVQVVEGLRREASRAVLVHGNSDPVEIRHSLPAVRVLEVAGRRIGITHPAWGGPPFPPEELLDDFPEGRPDVVLFGHLHEPLVERRDGVLFVNPGQGYASFMVPATVAVVTVGEEVTAEIMTVAPAR